MTPAGRLLFNVLATVAEFESDLGPDPNQGGRRSLALCHLVSRRIGCAGAVVSWRLGPAGVIAARCLGVGNRGAIGFDRGGGAIDDTELPGDIQVSGAGRLATLVATERRLVVERPGGVAPRRCTTGCIVRHWYNCSGPPSPP